jgi:putative ABC transport system permease protein
MKLALREMRRRPGRFVTATVILTLIALLLMFLGGLLDGLVGSATSAIEAQRGDVITFSSTSQSSFPSSRLTDEERATISAVPGVDQVGGLSVTQLGARIPGNGPRDLIDVALFGYEIAPQGVPDPPPAGEAWADDSLREQGVSEGTELLLGPARSPIRIAGFVTGLQYNGQATLWSSADTRREVQNANRPDAREGDGVFQTFVVIANDGSSPTDLATRIDAATGDATETLGVTAAANAQPGVSEQRSTFNQIIGVTIVIAIVVVALFFALLIVERTALYGVLKAMGARSGTIFGGVVAQAVVVTAVATAIGAAISIGVAAIIPAGGIPFIVTPARILSSVAYLLLAAVIGCAFSLRRVLRIDPASAIGSAS